jgi:hypothetical protein
LQKVTTFALAEHSSQKVCPCFCCLRKLIFSKVNLLTNPLGLSADKKRKERREGYIFLYQETKSKQEIKNKKQKF